MRKRHSFQMQFWFMQVMQNLVSDDPCSLVLTMYRGVQGPISTSDTVH